MIERAAASNADLVFLDLEDSVAPNEKVAARKRVIDALNGLDWGKKAPCGSTTSRPNTPTRK
jgi:citrate lyase subunit beta/citryl-CoA lyase